MPEDPAHPDAPPPRCAVCGRPTPAHLSYLVRIDVYADPAMPPTSAAEIAATNFDAEMADLLKQMQHLTAEDLQDDVHRRFEYRLCRPCHRDFLRNPLGKPRGTRTSEN